MKDQAMDARFQDSIIAGSDAQWIKEDVDAEHEAYETHPEEIVQIIEKYAERWSS